MAKLGDVCTIYAGTGFPIKYQGCTEGDFPFYKVGDIAKNVTNGFSFLNLCDNYIDSEVCTAIKGTIIPSRTVVFAKIGEAVKLNRRAITSVPCLIDNNAMGIKPDENIISLNYFYYFMCHIKLEKFAEATTVPSVKKSVVETIEIPLPPLETQKQIAATLDKVTALIDMHKRQLELLEELVKGRFVEMFGDLKTNPFNWKRKNLLEVAEIDTTMVKDYAKYADYPHIGIDSIEKETGRLFGYRTIAEDGVISGKYLFTDKHIIYSKIRPNLNKVAMPDFKGLCSADAYPILPKEKICTRVYLGHVMRSEFFLDYILPFSRRANMPKVNKEQLSGFVLPVPPIELQTQFSAFVTQTDKSKSSIQQSLAKLETLKKSLMQEYFG